MTRSKKAQQRVLTDNIAKAREALRISKEQASSAKVQAVKQEGKYLPVRIHSYRNKKGQLVSVLAMFRADQPNNPYMALKVSARTALMLLKQDAGTVRSLASVIIADRNNQSDDE